MDSSSGMKQTSKQILLLGRYCNFIIAIKSTQEPKQAFSYTE